MQAPHEPAFILAASSQQPAAAAAAAAASAPSERTLHCCYACSPGASGAPAVLVATDERGELLASRLLPSGGAPGGAGRGAAADGCRAVLSAALQASTAPQECPRG